MNEFDDSDHEPLTANEVRSGAYSNDESYLKSYSNDKYDDESESDKSDEAINKPIIKPKAKAKAKRSRSRKQNNKIFQVEKEIENAKDAVRQSLVKAVDRGDRLESISITADNLHVEADLFKKQAKRTRMQLIFMFIFTLII